MRGKLRDLTMNRDGTQNITLTVQDDFRNQFDQLSDKDLDVEIKIHRERRSRDANNFCWALCTDIGKNLVPPLPKEEVYKRAIRAVGEYEPLPIKAEAVETFQTRWAGKGTGWFAEVVDDSKIPGYKLLFAYYGSSTYDTKSMSILIDHLVDDAQQMEIKIPLGKSEIERLKSTWGTNFA